MSQSAQSNFREFLVESGLRPGMHVMMHSGFRSIRQAFPGISIEKLIGDVREILTPDGSLLMPVFTYCLKKNQGDYEIFDREETPSKVGAVSEVFRNMPDVVRTAAPSHSFALWGAVTKDLDETNAPSSPLGKGSPAAWLSRQDDGYIMLLGTDFTALSFGHFMEIKAGLPWADYNPWGYMHVDKTGVSTEGEQELVEIPGCSKSFVNLQQYLEDNNFLNPFIREGLISYLVSVQTLQNQGLKFFKQYPEHLLCKPETCPACDARWKFYIEHIKNKI